MGPQLSILWVPSVRLLRVAGSTHRLSIPFGQGRELPQEESQFSFGFEKPEISQDELRALIWNEMASFHPELR